MGRMLGEMRPIDNEDDGAQPKISHNIYINGIMQIINIPFVVYFPLRPVYNINKRIWKHIQQNKTQTKDIISILNDVYNAREITQLYYYTSVYRESSTGRQVMRCDTGTNSHHSGRHSLSLTLSHSPNKKKKTNIHI